MDKFFFFFAMYNHHHHHHLCISSKFKSFLHVTPILYLSKEFKGICSINILSEFIEFS